MAGIICTFAHEKGGVTKTTQACELAVNATRDGLKVVVIDADHQQSATKWMMRREAASPDLPPIRVVPVVGKSVGTQIRGFASDYDLVVVDTGGRDSQEMRLAMLTSHLVIVPTSAKAMETDGLNKMSSLINETRLANPDLKAWLLLSNVQAGQIANERAALSECLDNPISADVPDELIRGVIDRVMDGYATHRKAFADVYAWGRGVVEMKPQDAKAVAEALAVYEEIRSHG